MPIEFAAFAIIQNDSGRVLWKQRRDLGGLWDLPGGTADEKDYESGRAYAETCLKREVKEETGLEIEPIAEIGLYHSEAVSKETQSIAAFYLCRVIGGTLRKTDESADFDWFRLDSLPQNSFVLHERVFFDFQRWEKNDRVHGEFIGGDLRGLVDHHRARMVA